MSTAVTFQEQGIHSQADAIQLANEIHRLEAALKQMKGELKSYVKMYGKVDTGEEIWDFYESISWKFDRLKELAGEMAMEGIDPWEMMSISKANINKLGWEEQRLSNLGTKKVTHRFTSRKK